MWFVNKPVKNDLHPTMKPVELVITLLLPFGKLCAKAKPIRHAAPPPSSLGVRARAIGVISDCDG